MKELLIPVSKVKHILKEGRLIRRDVGANTALQEVLNALEDLIEEFKQ